MQKVLHIGLSYERGGIEGFVMNYYRSIESIIQFDFINPYNKPLAYEKEILSMGGIVYRLPDFHKKPILFRKELKSIIKTYEVVHIHMLSAANLIPLQVAAECNVRKIIAHSHNTLAEGIIRQVLHRIHYKKIKKYANIYVNEEEAKNYFKNNGIEVKDNIVNIDNSLAGNITVYIEDKSGNYHIEYIRLSENNILDYVSNGLVLLLDGVKNTRNGHSTSTSVWEDLSGNNNDLTLENVVQNSNNMYLNGNDSKMYSEKALDVVSVEIVLELEEKNGYVYIASFGSYLKSMAWSVESDKGFSLGHMKKKYFVENLYKKNSISVQYNPDLMYLNSERLTNNLASESWSSTSSYPIAFGFYGNNAYRMKGKIYSIRIYNRALTQDEINHNYMVDKVRFGIK